MYGSTSILLANIGDSLEIWLIPYGLLHAFFWQGSCKSCLHFFVLDASKFYRLQLALQRQVLLFTAAASSKELTDGVLRSVVL